ncbi:DUF6230 family protein [Marinactinospora thermotolerans]|uniref:Cholesterol esterase n=1 Tax=Marinactinospora thermotolerans DSM 45154 TaxID=1122192 RepID=A0A1T4REI5_9ACTN|nr:DUF6230 family protein [Marinactinospora thermotolerans]SKA14440.1 hypothetical protein SAMN02745673_02758 [Marinactinospora thermotolerans DSM 45154]
MVEEPLDQEEQEREGSHTSWRRFALLTAPAALGAGALVFAIANGAIAASFAVSGQQFKISADEMNGEGVAIYGSLDQSVRGDVHPVAVAAIREAEITSLCQSVITEFPILGKVSLKLSAGTDGTPVEASNLFIDMTQMAGDTEFSNLEIGRDASTLDKGPSGGQGVQDLFGMQGDTISVRGLEQTAWAANAGSFRLSGLHLAVARGDAECF